MSGNEPQYRETHGPTRVLLSWSGGKDSALALHRLRSDPAVTVAGLITTVTASYDRVSTHGVRRSLLHEQAASLGLPLHEIELPPSPTNEQYQAAWRAALGALPATLRAARCIAFGDIALEDVRAYREAQVGALGCVAIFPLWGEPPDAIVDEVLGLGFAATLVCVDTQALPAAYAGRSYDASLLDELPPSVDPCGEGGEFHTFVYDGPGFATRVRFETGDTVIRDDRFAFCDLVPVGAPGEQRP